MVGVVGSAMTNDVYFWWKGKMCLCSALIVLQIQFVCLVLKWDLVLKGVP
jgi:hypothetical protein